MFDRGGGGVPSVWCMGKRFAIVLAVSALVLGTAGAGAAGAQSTQSYGTDFNHEAYKCLSPTVPGGAYQLVSQPKGSVPGYTRVLAQFPDGAACRAEQSRIVAPFTDRHGNRVRDPQNKVVLPVPNPVVDLQKKTGTSGRERVNAQSTSTVRVTGGGGRLTPEQIEQRQRSRVEPKEQRIENAIRAAQARIDIARRRAERLGDAALEALGRKPGSADEALFNSALPHGSSNGAVSAENLARFKEAGLGDLTPEQHSIATSLAIQSASANAALDAAIQAMAQAIQSVEFNERDAQCYATPEDC